MARGLFECLHEANLGQHIEQFRLHGVSTLECLTSLTMQDYAKLGITSAKDRKRLFHLIHIVKGVKEERRTSSFTMEMTSKHDDKENQPLESSHEDSKNKSLPGKDIDEIPDDLKIQWTPRKKGRCSDTSNTDIVNQKNIHSIGDIISSDVSPKTSDTSNNTPMTNIHIAKMDTLTQIDSEGGILFTSAGCEPTSPRTRRSGTHHQLAQSLSDSEIVVDHHTDSFTAVAHDITGFGAPKLKSSSVEVIDHSDKRYNYGIPGHKVTPVRKQPGLNKSVTTSTSKIQVCVRKRPLLKKERNEVDIIGTEGQQTVLLNEAKVAVDLTQFMQVVRNLFPMLIVLVYLSNILI